MCIRRGRFVINFDFIEIFFPSFTWKCIFFSWWRHVANKKFSSSWKVILHVINKFLWTISRFCVFCYQKFLWMQLYEISTIFLCHDINFRCRLYLSMGCVVKIFFYYMCGFFYNMALGGFLTLQERAACGISGYSLGWINMIDVKVIKFPSNF